MGGANPLQFYKYYCCRVTECSLRAGKNVGVCDIDKKNVIFFDNDN